MTDQQDELPFGIIFIIVDATAGHIPDEEGDRHSCLARITKTHWHQSDLISVIRILICRYHSIREACRRFYHSRNTSLMHDPPGAWPMMMILLLGLAAMMGSRRVRDATRRIYSLLFVPGAAQVKLCFVVFNVCTIKLFKII